MMQRLEHIRDAVMHNSYPEQYIEGCAGSATATSCCEENRSTESSLYDKEDK